MYCCFFVPYICDSRRLVQSCVHLAHVFSRWLYGKISREQAESLLRPRQDGLYLVRESTSFPGDYTLCVCFEGKVEHYRVMCTDSQMTIDNEEFFNNLKQLIEVRSTERCLQTSFFCCNFDNRRY